MSRRIETLTKRAVAAFAALCLGASVAIASLLAPLSQTVSASATGGQVSTRSIKMSTSTPSATAQSYDVTFTANSSATVKGIIIDFCSGSAGSPIVGDSSCTAPTGMSLSGTSFTDNPDSVGANLASVSGWTAATLNSGRTFELHSSSGTTTTGGTSIFNFAITGITNPSTLGTFYARAVTYTTEAAAAAYTAGSEGTYQDYGGFALSTAQNINITAKVQETLTFCTSGPTTPGGLLDPMDGNNGGSDCTAATTPNITIGHGSPVQIIDNSQIDASAAFMQLSTNATSGAVVRMHASNSCSTPNDHTYTSNAGLSVNGGALCNINGIGYLAAGNNTGPQNNTAVALASAVPNTGQAAFGLFVGNGYTTTGNSASTATGAAGSFVPDSNYHDNSYQSEANLATHPALNDLHYGMDSSANGVQSTYGDTIANTGNSPCNTTNAHLIFGAIASLTTPAGIYKGSESLIATGTF